MWKDDLSAQVAASPLSAEDKEAWLAFADVLDDEMGGFLATYLKEEPGALERMNEEVRLKKEYLETGDDTKLKQIKSQNKAQIDALTKDRGNS